MALAQGQTGAALAGTNTTNRAVAIELLPEAPLPPGTLQMDRPHAGNRTRTVCVYLNAVEAGGATTFPVPGLSIDPLPGRAVVFDNLTHDGSPDPDSLHAGTPVEAGEKWLATLWIRQGRYRYW